MKRKQLIFSLLVCLLASSQGFSQTVIVCNDLVSVILDQGCTHTIEKEEILEGSYCTTCDYAVEIDKVLPYGNGPWVPAVVGTADLGKTYSVRVKELASGNYCWGNVKIVEALECTGVTTVNLDGGAPATLLPADLQINFVGNCMAIDPATTMNNGQPSVTYDCNDLGVHILQVTASDALGNTAYCQTTVVVDDPASECNNCIACPPATSVTFQTGGSVLIPAYQSGDWVAFDAYGEAVYNNACTFEDSTYSVDYYTSPFGQNWFVRRWEGKDAGGQVTAQCEQVITFPFYQNITVGGKVYLDTLQNCQYDVGEQGVTIFNVVATILPSNEQIVATPDPDGSYQFDLQVDGMDTEVIVQYSLPPGLNSACPTTLSIPANTTTQQHIFDIGLQSEVECPLMEISMSTPFLRRCQDNLFYIQYCNNGFLAAEDAYVVVSFDALFEVESATLPWLSANGNEYTFNLGDVPPLTCGTFYIVAHLSCDASVGQTLCNDATVYPHDPCGVAAWDGPVIETTAICDGDTVVLSVWNTGTQPMIQEKQYIVIEDVIMYRQGNFQLGAGDSIAIKMPANGSTWRIEAEQMTGYPVPDEPSAAVESCGGLNSPGLINAFATNDAAAYFDRACETVIASCDPNDKNAVPTGYGAFNTIRANTDLEYKIRFQNTGTDTAFRVVIVDTLTTLLDGATLKAGASSHPYRLDVYPGGILHFVFDPIILPDSNINEVASHGFVSFRISQQPDLPDGTVIENKAAIYFDFNDAVITNTSWHTIGKPYVTVEVEEPVEAGVRVHVRPNPFHDRSSIQIEGMEIRQGLFTMFDAQGKTIREMVFQGNQLELERQQMPQGLYFFRISADGKSVAQGKLQAY